MTDAEIVRACAEKVMGWAAPITDKPGSMLQWNPLTNEADCWQMVDSQRADTIRRIDDYLCKIARSQGHTAFLWWLLSMEPADRRRAIVLACLRAVGVEVWAG